MPALTGMRGLRSLVGHDHPSPQPGWVRPGDPDVPTRPRGQTRPAHPNPHGPVRWRGIRPGMPLCLNDRAKTWPAPRHLLPRTGNGLAVKASRKTVRCRPATRQLDGQIAQRRNRFTRPHRYRRYTSHTKWKLTFRLAQNSAATSHIFVSVPARSVALTQAILALRTMST